VHVLGQLSEEDKARMLASVDVFVAPNLGKESFGIVLLEAMAAGAPVLATRVGGVPETVRDGVNGLLTPADDADAMAASLRVLLGDSGAAQARAAQASVDVEAYDWRHIADQYEACYADALRGATR
jgi:phosphatidylinositol alpha-mannosyltransferase